MFTRLTAAFVCLLFLPVARTAGADRVDQHGDSLPSGAVARIGTVRFRAGERLSSIAFSGDGKTIAGGGWGNEIRIWDVPSGKVRRILPGHGEYVRGLAFFPKGSRLASVGSDKVVRIWDTESGKRLHELENRGLNPVVGSRRMASESRVQPTITRLLVQLNDDRFAVRDEASRQLEKLGFAAEPALRRKVGEKLDSLELRRRLERLLGKLRAEALPAEMVRAIRAVELLERIGDAQAVRLIEELAGGAAEARLTRETRSALVRLREPKRPEK